MHEADPETYSVKRLAKSFSLEEKRVSAVIILKRLEQQLLASGQKLQVDFQQKMEQMLGKKPLQDEKKIVRITPQAPYLAAFKENEVFEKEEAIKLLNQQTKKENKKKPKQIIFENYQITFKEISQDMKPEFKDPVKKLRQRIEFNQIKCVK